MYTCVYECVHIMCLAVHSTKQGEVGTSTTYMCIVCMYIPGTYYYIHECVHNVQLKEIHVFYKKKK